MVGGGGHKKRCTSSCKTVAKNHFQYIYIYIYCYLNVNFSINIRHSFDNVESRKSSYIFPSLYKRWICIRCAEQFEFVPGMKRKEPISYFRLMKMAGKTFILHIYSGRYASHFSYAFHLKYQHIHRQICEQSETILRCQRANENKQMEASGAKKCNIIEDILRFSFSTLTFFPDRISSWTLFSFVKGYNIISFQVFSSNFYFKCNLSNCWKLLVWEMKKPIQNSILKKEIIYFDDESLLADSFFVAVRFSRECWWRYNFVQFSYERTFFKWHNFNSGIFGFIMLW